MTILQDMVTWRLLAAEGRGWKVQSCFFLQVWEKWVDWVVVDGASLISETRLKLPTDSRIGFFEMSRFKENVRYVPWKYLKLAKKYFFLLACLGMWQMRKTATMTTRTMARFASRRPDLPERMWVYLQYITLHYSTVPASGSHYNQEGNYPDIYISTSTYKFIHERWIHSFLKG